MCVSIHLLFCNIVSHSLICNYVRAGTLAYFAHSQLSICTVDCVVFFSYGESGLANNDSVGIQLDGKNITLHQRVGGKRSFNVKVTNLSRLGGKPAKQLDQCGKFIFRVVHHACVRAKYIICAK